MEQEIREAEADVSDLEECLNEEIEYATWLQHRNLQSLAFDNAKKRTLDNIRYLKRTIKIMRQL